MFFFCHFTSPQPLKRFKCFSRPLFYFQTTRKRRSFLVARYWLPVARVSFRDYQSTVFVFSSIVVARSCLLGIPHAFHCCGASATGVLKLLHLAAVQNTSICCARHQSRYHVRFCWRYLVLSPSATNLETLAIS